MVDNNDGKVVNLAAERARAEEVAEVAAKAKVSPEFDFEAQAAINKAKADKKAKERLDANKGVLRSYRIKP